MLMMSDDDTLYDALLARDARFEGRAWVGVRTTGIFCRLSCPARKPKRENVAFFDTVAACLDAGFRPCQRCRPLASLAAQDPVVQRLLGLLDTEPARRWVEADIAALGLDPSTVRRAFRRALGATFLKIARLTRLRMGAAARVGGARVIDAQFEAGFESASGFRAAFARLMGRPPGAISGEERLLADWIDTPLGPMIAVADDAALWLLEFADRRALPDELRAVAQETGSPIGFGRPDPTERAADELRAYFDGRQAVFKTPTAAYGAAFSRRVWAALRAIPPGQTCAYADLAVAVGMPTAVRAVARANGANRLGIVVPCHRVIAADGGLAGYGGGLWRKRWLIDHERRAFGDARHPPAQEAS